LQRTPYSEAEIGELIRGMACDAAAMRLSTLEAVVELDMARELFGSLAAAIREAGIAQVSAPGNQKWSRERVIERVIEELRARARRGLTSAGPVAAGSGGAAVRLDGGGAADSGASRAA